VVRSEDRRGRRPPVRCTERYDNLKPSPLEEVSYSNSNRGPEKFLRALLFFECDSLGLVEMRRFANETFRVRRAYFQRDRSIVRLAPNRRRALELDA